MTSLTQAYSLKLPHSLVAVIALLVVQLRSWIGPLILAFVLAYLFYPIANWLREKVRISWSIAVGFIYLLLVLILIGLLTWGGITFVDPVQSLFRFIQKTLNQLPDFLDQLSEMSLTLGPINFDLSSFDLTSLAEQLLSLVQPILAQAGSLIGSFAAGAATLVGRVLFLLLVSYFILNETRGTLENLLDIRIPGYQEDLKRFGHELSRIWNAFLRGQLILMLIAIAIYSVFLGVFGVRYVFALALMAGFARFVPYIGPLATWITYFLVALLQPDPIFGLGSLVYALLVVGIAILIDTIIDNLLLPRIYAYTLRIHPAAVLVAILVAAAWLGFIGVVLAAPVLATLKLFWNYAIQKMFDRDPWEAIEADSITPERSQTFNWFVVKLKNLWKRGKEIKIFGKKDVSSEKDSNE